jgi:hypothetical protein
MSTEFWWGNLKFRGSLENLGAEVRTDTCIKISLKGTEWKSVEWINLAEDRERWRAVVNTVTEFLLQ